MKLSLSLCALALALTPLALMPQAAHAQRKRMGPSAVEAARLKKYPPNAVLAHYLPDDRYKIAGGVWKYVATDLDTYYHIPTSPNMMRQPADRVIGFANSHDAEEAGYEADPTDGTAARVAAGNASSVGGTGSIGGTAAEQLYLARITPILRASQREEATWLANLQSSARGGGGSTTLGQSLSAAVPMMRRTSSALSAVRPPKRYTRFHTLLLLTYKQGIAAVSSMNRNMAQGNFSLGGNSSLSQMMTTQLALVKEARRVGIDPQLVK